MEVKGCSDPIFYDEMIENDIVHASCAQVGIGKNSWLIGAIAALTPHHRILGKLFVSSRNKRQGIYTVKFWKNDRVRIFFMSS